MNLPKESRKKEIEKKKEKKKALHLAGFKPTTSWSRDYERCALPLSNVSCSVQSTKQQIWKTDSQEKHWMLLSEQKSLCPFSFNLAKMEATIDKMATSWNGKEVKLTFSAENCNCCKNKNICNIWAWVDWTYFAKRHLCLRQNGAHKMSWIVLLSILKCHWGILQNEISLCGWKMCTRSHFGN